MFHSPLFPNHPEKMTLIELVISLVSFFDQTNLFVLAMLAFVSHQAALSFFGRFPWQSGAKFLTAPFAIAFAVHAASKTDFQNDAVEAFVVLIRCGLVMGIIQNCVSVPVFFLCHLLTRSAQQEWDQLRKYSNELSEWHKEKAKQQAIIPQILEPIPREVSMRRSAEQARLDYDFECSIIESADLAEEEQEAALNESKQKYLQRLRNALQ